MFLKLSNLKFHVWISNRWNEYIQISCQICCQSIEVSRLWIQWCLHFHIANSMAYKIQNIMAVICSLPLVCDFFGGGVWFLYVPLTLPFPGIGLSTHVLVTWPCLIRLVVKSTPAVYCLYHLKTLFESKLVGASVSTQ